MIREIKIFFEVMREVVRDPEMRDLLKGLGKAFIQLIFYLSLFISVILWGVSPFLWEISTERMFACAVIIGLVIHSNLLDRKFRKFEPKKYNKNWVGDCSDEYEDIREDVDV